jgi:gamma-glutamyltranspeptidase / glutathione hydrolase
MIRRRSLCGLLVLGLSAAIFSQGAAAQWLAPEAQSGWSEKTLAVARRHMIAAANPLAAEAGREILRKGGTAVDAAIATQLVLGLVEPQSSGLGGGAFLVHWDAATRRVRSYDGRETAPAAARPDRFLVKGRPMPFSAVVKSPLSIGVPGTVRLLEHVHREHGKIEWAVLFEPAIRLAEAGFAVSSRLHRLLVDSGPGSFDAGARTYFFDGSGVAHPVGYVLRNAAYARTLRRIAAEGAAAFYSGAIADEIVTAARVEAGAGRLSLEDLARDWASAEASGTVPSRLEACGCHGAGSDAPDRGGTQARLRRPKLVPRRSGSCDHSGRAPGSGLYGGAATADVARSTDRAGPSGAPRGGEEGGPGAG